MSSGKCQPFCLKKRQMCEMWVNTAATDSLNSLHSTTMPRNTPNITYLLSQPYQISNQQGKSEVMWRLKLGPGIYSETFIISSFDRWCMRHGALLPIKKLGHWPPDLGPYGATGSDWPTLLICKHSLYITCKQDVDTLLIQWCHMSIIVSQIASNNTNVRQSNMPENDLWLFSINMIKIQNVRQKLLVCVIA